MVEYHIWNESLSSRHFQFHLTTYISESLSQFKQKPGDIGRKFILQLLLGRNSLVNKSEIIRAFQNRFCETTIWSRQLLIEVGNGVASFLI